MFGPVIVTADEVGNPHDLVGRLYMNDVLRGRSYTGAIMDPIHAIVSLFSRLMTLKPGTLFAMGAAGFDGFAVTPDFRRPGENRLAVGEVSSKDGRGKHTTTSRELMMLSGGSMVIDTPGLRELGLWGDEEGLEETFSDIMKLSEACRFRDCAHEVEPGCAILEALERGELDEGRYRSFLSLRAELGEVTNRRLERKRWGRQMAKMVKEVNRFNPKRK